MYDLIYAPIEVENIIKAKYPQAKISDASDDIHRERFEMTLEGIEEDEFYPFAIKEGFARCCITFEMRMLQKEEHDKIRKWIDLAKPLKEEK